VVYAKWVRPAAFVVACLISPALGLAADGKAPLPSPNDLHSAKSAYEAAQKGNWSAARDAAARVDDPLLQTILAWQRATAGGSSATFDEIERFRSQHPNWPAKDLLRLRAEEAMSPAYPDRQVIAWFGDKAPLSVEGAARLADALLGVGRTSDAHKLIRKTWIEGNFGDQQEKQFYNQFKKYLTKQDHIERLDRLAWADREAPAKRMFPKVGQDYRALTEARFALHNVAKGADGALKRVPASLKDDPGLTYERLRWRRIKNRDDEALDMLKAFPEANKINPGRWWQERSILARRALMKGHISDAYHLAANNGLKDGSDLLDAEWLAGWIALRFLKDDKVAYDHFTKVYREARLPISKARGAYWAARAAEAMKDDERSRFWFKTAYGFPTTYYGQLASAKLPKTEENTALIAPKLDPKGEPEFNRNELVRAVRIIDAAGMTELLRPFIRQLTESGRSPDFLTRAALLATETGRPDLAIFAAKRAEAEGVSVVQAGYPVLPGKRTASVEDPLIHAVIRQESAFNTNAVSRAGALGLMQLMPGTAKVMAKRNDLPFAHEKLTADPDYNMKLGQSYLSNLVSDFDGSYILAVAAYNAGPGRVREWMREYGDPRDKAVDVIDWIEMVPYAETRNYIQRVLESLHVYRMMMTPTQVALTPELMRTR
jgi:soluble lytic murein transglycosylase